MRRGTGTGCWSGSTTTARVSPSPIASGSSRARDSGGFGLGLAIVRELVRSRGGDVRLTASPAGGLRAEVELPAGPPD